MKKIWIAICLVIGVYQTAIANDLTDKDFAHLDTAFTKWLGMESAYSYTSTSLETIFKDGFPIALDELFGQGKWKLRRMVNYTYNYRTGRTEAWMKSGSIVQTKQGPFVEELKNRAYYFIAKEADPDRARLIMSVQGQYGYIYFKAEDDEHKGLAEEFRSDLEDNGLIQAIYKGKVLEYKSSSVGFYPGVDNYKYQWDNFIFPSQEKNNITKTIDGFIDFYDRDEWVSLGLPLNRGVLLYGPPGTGKSFIAKVIISNIMQKRYKNRVTYMHVSARHVITLHDIRKIYQAARVLTPAVVFIEDIDLIAGTDRTDRAEVKNELMQQLSGLEKLEGVLTVGTTNYFDLIDPALKRSKRLGFHFNVNKPALIERQQLFRLFLNDVDFEDIDLVKYASLTEGMTGADIKEIVELAVEEAIRKKSFDDDKQNVFVKEEHVRRALQLKRKYNLKKS